LIPEKEHVAAQPAQFGKALLEDFPDGKVSIWSWNVNGINKNAQTGTLKDFIERT